MLAITLGPVCAAAGQYVIDQGEHLAVCRAYRDNLNAFKPNFPIGCGRGFTALHSEIGIPDWRPLETNEHYAKLLPKISNLFWNRDANPAYYYPVPDWKGSADQLAKAHGNYVNSENARGRVYNEPFAAVDIDNDGQADNIFLDKGCGLEGALLVVLNDAGTDIDRAKTRLVMRHPSWKEWGQRAYRTAGTGESLLDTPPDLAKRGLKLTEDALHFASYSVFLYAGKTYFDLWWSARPEYRGRPDYEMGKLHVFLAQDRKAQEICTYRFALTPEP